MIEQEKLSANQRWKRSGTTLPFKDWLQREDAKKESVNSDVHFIPFVSSDTQEYSKPYVVKALNADGEVVTTSNPNQTFGIDNTYLLIAGIVVVGAISFVIWKKYSKAK
jgi:hypothetical protein